MHKALVFIGVVIHILSVISLIYVLIMLSKSEKAKKTQIARLFEYYHREKLFRNSLVILMLSFLFDGIAAHGALFHTLNGETVERMSIISHLLIFVFLLY